LPGMTEPTAPIFRALADANRRVLLDRLFERDGQTLGELCGYLPEMTRFGVMKHLGVLEEAGLVTTVKVGREKRHYLNPVPIRLVHDRWISKFAEPVVGAMSAIKSRLETPMDTLTTSTPSSSRQPPTASGAPSPKATKQSATTSAPASRPTGPPVHR
jgi:DNA-binding transcriptional ArsR family regulator